MFIRCPSSGALRTHLPQTQKGPRNPSCNSASSNRAVVLSIGFGPSSKDKKISPGERPAASIDCQIVHRARSLWMKEFRSSGVQEFRSSGVQEFRSSGVQEFRSSGWYEPQNYNQKDLSPEF